MGAKPKALQKRMKRAWELAEKLGHSHIYWLGDEFPEENYTFKGVSTEESIWNFIKNVPCKPKEIYVITAWYHIPRCNLFLKNWGVKVYGVCSDWKIWRTPLKIIMREYKKYKKTKEFFIRERLY